MKNKIYPLGCKKNNSIKNIPFKVQYLFLYYFCTQKGVKMTENIAVFIKEKRKQLKLTQPELAERAGVGLRFVRELEQGKQTVRLDKVNQVLTLFGTEVGVIQKNES
jgi:y4mF family transcriptional regulator